MRIISPKQVRDKTNVSERQQARLVERGQFPKPIPLYEDGRRIGFIEEEIEEWMAARVAAARGTPRATGAAAKAAQPAAAGAEPAVKNGHETPPAGRRPQRRAQPPPRRPQRGAAPKTPI